MKITGVDHANWRINDVERSFGFYRDVLGLETFGLEEYRAGERSFVSVRVSPAFTLHLLPVPEASFGYANSRDHLALVVEATGPEDLESRLRKAGLEIEHHFASALGARGDGPALYVRDPDDHLIELKVYGS
jgi:catechol 2,3-dioxygenase-like lactoylglutathione lyase family enzyme